VEDDTADVAATEVDRPTQGVGHQGGGHGLVHGPADQTTAAQVEHRGQVEPALVGADVGDVPGPSPVRLTRGEVLVDEVGQRWRPFGRHGGAGRLALGRDPDDGVGGHEPLGALVVHAVAPATELRGHPRAAVGGVRLGVDVHDVVDQVGLVELGLGGTGGRPSQS